MYWRIYLDNDFIYDHRIENSLNRANPLIKFARGKIFQSHCHCVINNIFFFLLASRSFLYNDTNNFFCLSRNEN